MRSSVAVLGLLASAAWSVSASTVNYQLFERAGEDHRGDPFCPSGFDLLRTEDEEVSWRMTGFTTTDAYPFCTNVFASETDVCPSGMTFVKQDNTTLEGDEYYGCDGLSTTCCGYAKPTGCGTGGHCPKPLGSDGTLCQVPWTDLCNGQGSCQDNQCVCEHGFDGETCADAPPCHPEDDYKQWIPATKCYPLCGVNRQQTFKKIPNEDKYWCPTIIGQRECEYEPSTVNCSSLTELANVFWERTDYDSLAAFVGDSGAIDGDIVSFLLAQDAYAGRQDFTGEDSLKEAIEGYRSRLGMLDLLTGENVRDHLNQLHQFSGNEDLGTNSLTQHLLHVVDTTGANVHDNALRDLIGVSLDTIVYPEDVEENLVQTILEIAERLGDSPKEEFGDIDTLRTLLLLNQTKVNQYKSDMCEYYEAPLRPKGCTGHCGYGSRTIRWVPKPGQPSYCTVIHEEEECTLHRTCPVYEGGDESVGLGDISCRYSDWSSWSVCQTSGHPGDVRGWQGRSRDLEKGHDASCISTLDYRPCDPLSGRALMNPNNLFVQQHIVTSYSSSVGILGMSILGLILTLLYGCFVMNTHTFQFSGKRHVA